MASFSAEFSDTSSMDGPRARANGTASDYCPLQWWMLNCNSVQLTMWLKVVTFTYYSQNFTFYSSIIPDARTYLLFPKLCQHNMPVPRNVATHKRSISAIAPQE